MTRVNGGRAQKRYFTMTDPRISRFSKCYTSVVHDVLRAMGESHFTLPPRITALQPDSVLCGPAWTVSGQIVENADAHKTLLAWTGLLSKAKPGHIWIAQPHTHLIAQMGELSAETLKLKGILGCVIDGAIRDSDFILNLGFPAWRTHHTPRDVVGVWLPTATEEAIKIDDLIIEPGDWLHGDRDGMVCVRASLLDQVIELCEQAMQTENKVRAAILGGKDPQQAYINHGKF